MKLLCLSPIAVSLSADEKLETEGDGEEGVEQEIPKYISSNVYHAKGSLRYNLETTFPLYSKCMIDLLLFFNRTAISDWIPEFSVPKQAHGPVTKPQPQVTSEMLAKYSYINGIDTVAFLLCSGHAHNSHYPVNQHVHEFDYAYYEYDHHCPAHFQYTRVEHERVAGTGRCL